MADMDNLVIDDEDGITMARPVFSDVVKVSVRRRQPKPDEATEAKTITEEKNDGSTITTT